MKVKVKKNKEFTPFKVELEIETKDELYYMWHLTNNRLDVSCCDDDVPIPHDLRNVYFLWEAFNKKVKEFNEEIA